jgi:hypothetical protein
MTAFRILRYIIVGCGLMATLWFAGLWLFVDTIKTMHEPDPQSDNQSTDAVVVLTGGSERLATGLAILKDARASKLLISGVHPGLTLDRLPVSKLLYDCCITIGHEAESTFGNAEETRNWMMAENFHSLRVVTANYHMPRSLMIFHALMPETILIPHPVQPDSVKLDQWWAHSGTASLLVTEYNKFLFAWLRTRVHAE